MSLQNHYINFTQFDFLPNFFTLTRYKCDIDLYRYNLIELCECANPSSLNGQVIKDLFLIEKILIEAQEKVLQKRIEMTQYIRQNEEKMLNKFPNNQVMLPMVTVAPNQVPLPNQLPPPIQETQKQLQIPQNRKLKRPAEVIDLESEEQPREQKNFEIEVNVSNSDKKQKKTEKKNKKNKTENPFPCHQCDKRLSTKGSLIFHLATQHRELLNQNRKLETVDGI